MKKVVVVLKLSRLTIPQKIAKARFIVTSMTGNAFFIAPNPLPNPALSVITTDVNALETASIAAQGGGKDETAVMHAKEEILDRDVSILAAYIQMVANNNLANAEPIVFSAGMDIKSAGVHTAHEFAVINTKNPGEVKLVTQFENRSVFNWQMSTDISLDTNWQTIGMATQAKLLKNGLISGKRYYFRVASISKDGQQPWSNVLNIIVL